MIIKVDVHSHLRPGHVYGRKGEEVTIVKEFETVLIVQNSCGNRFPVNPKSLTFESNDEARADPPGSDNKVPTVAPEKVSKLRPKSRTDRTGGKEDAMQPSLF
jgi:hypothetical protein